MLGLALAFGVLVHLLHPPIVCLLLTAAGLLPVSRQSWHYRVVYHRRKMELLLCLANLDLVGFGGCECLGERER